MFTASTKNKYIHRVGCHGPVEIIINETRVARPSWSCIYIIIMKNEYEFDRYQIQEKIETIQSA